MTPWRGTLGIFILSLLIQLPVYNRWISVMDEGLILQIAAEINRGKLLYRDAVHYAFPGVFYFLASLFHLFGPSIEIARVAMAVMFAIMSVLIYLISRRLMSPACAVFTALVFIAYRFWAFPQWHALNYSPLAIFFLTLALWLLYRHLDTGSLLPLGGAGGMIGCAILSKQDYGSTVLLALNLFLLLRSFSRLRGLLWFNVAAASVVFPVFLFFAWHGALRDILHQTAVLPIKGFLIYRYLSLPHLWPLFGQDTHLRENFYSYFPAPLLTFHSREILQSFLYRQTFLWDLSLKLVYHLPYLTWIASAIYLIRCRRSGEGGRRWWEGFLFLVFAGGILLAFNKPRDWAHLMVLYFPTLCLGGFLLHSLLARGGRLRAGTLFFLAILSPLYFLASAWLGWELWRRCPSYLPHPRARVFVEPQNAQVLTDLMRYIHEVTAPAEPIAVFPYHPLIYFLADKEGLTRSYLIWPVEDYANRDEDIIAALEKKRVRAVIYSFSQFTHLGRFQENAPELFAYLSSHYRMGRVFTVEPWDNLLLCALERTEGEEENLSYRFSDHFAEASVATLSASGDSTPISQERRADYVGITVWPFRQVLYEKPLSGGARTVLRFPISVPPSAHLQFSFGVNPDHWVSLEPVAVTFMITVEEEGEVTTVFSRTIDPQRRVQERRWFDVDLDLRPYGGRDVTIAFLTGCASPQGERPDFAAWANPRLRMVTPQ